MKKVLNITALVIALLVVFSSNTFAQKKFKGIITYAMSYSGEIDAATAAQQPKTMTLSIYENKSRMTIPLGPVTLELITNGDSKTLITLLDLMGDKKYYKMTTEEIEKEIAEDPKPEIKYLEETKTIAGYTCKKAEYSTTDEDGNTSTTIVYYTEELGGDLLNYGGQFNGLKGVPLEYESTREGIITKVSATEVKKGKVKDTDMLIPSDYTELTPEEKQQMIDQLKGE